MRSIRQIKNLKGKKVLVRVDFNVPIKNGRILDDFRIKKALPTIKFLEKKGAKIILITHLGKNGNESLAPIIKRFFEISKCSKSQVSFFDNIRKFTGEAKNDLNFAKKLSVLGDVYVNDAFSVSHRAHASIVGLPKYLPGYAGFQLEEEIKNLSKTIKNIKHPFLFIAGGVKFSTKIPLIQKYLKLADYVFIGGSLLNIFLKAKGYEVGRSFLENINYNFKKILKNKKLILPEDVVVKSGNKLINKKINQIKKDEIILDVGNKSVKSLTQLIKKSKLILWNGPLGKYEDGGARATKKVLKMVSKSKAQSIIGGGDIVYFVSYCIFCIFNENGEKILFCVHRRWSNIGFSGKRNIARY
ncbi:MAG: Phosphoglycerate kinase [Candidatus Nomurabacteria bacterium GW2011_GWA1_35_8]|uniref:Phosphoglycerate kinase n=1 Tax=Candidatus Nomurabacteria bacterium GW2011_GWA1_35_8 TaxID=1618727 RepID=A0A0G0CVH3_9BACT|nr:MAG: Phosphoglycerate kinase [Candidatus Nomurabacteria bacterium GW2011_GWA1_35_8]